MPALESLELDFEPYFVLGSYCHNAGVKNATVSVPWLAASFPRLQRLSCHYLEVEGQGESENGSVALDVDQGESEGGREGLDGGDRDGGRHESSDGDLGSTGASQTQAATAPSSRGPALPRLTDLSFVAVVRNSAICTQWNSINCKFDLRALAKEAPGLETVEVRCPVQNLGRASWRAGQVPDDFLRILRKFCAAEPAAFATIRGLLPALRLLSVEALRLEPEDCLLGGLGRGLSDLLLGPQRPASLYSGRQAAASTAAGRGGGRMEGEGPLPLVLRVGGPSALVERIRAVAAEIRKYEATTGLLLEGVEP